MAATNQGQDSRSGLPSSRLWHRSINQLLEDVESIAADYLHRHIADHSPQEQERMVYDISMSFINRMEMIGLIVVDLLTGELVHNLSVVEWTRMADDFTGWYDELELASSAQDLQSQQEVDAATERALGFLQGNPQLQTGSEDPNRMDSLHQDVPRRSGQGQDQVLQQLGSSDPRSSQTQVMEEQWIQMQQQQQFQQFQSYQAQMAGIQQLGSTSGVVDPGSSQTQMTDTQHLQCDDPQMRPGSDDPKCADAQGQGAGNFPSQHTRMFPDGGASTQASDVTDAMLHLKVDRAIGLDSVYHKSSTEAFSSGSCFLCSSQLRNGPIFGVIRK